MGVILHCADIHLSAGDDRDYSLSVLREIVDLASRQQVDLLLVAGDLFDSFADAEALRADVRQIFDNLPSGTQAIALAGNHDVLRKPAGRELTNLDFGRLSWATEKPFATRSFDDFELVTIPHSKDYNNAQSWTINPAQQPRVLAAHGIIAGMVYAPGSEEDQSVIDTALLERFAPAYVAMGHVHSARDDQSALHIAYPGSARVWRASKTETGPRKVNLVTVKDRQVTVKSIPLSAAGQFIEKNLYLALDGTIDWKQIDSSDFASTDMLAIRLFGMIEKEESVKAVQREIDERLRKKVRVLVCDSSALDVMEGISTHPLARKFITIWKQKEPRNGNDHDRRIWWHTLQEGLQAIKEVMEARS